MDKSTAYAPVPPEHLKRLNAALALREIPDYPATLDQLQQALKLAPTDPSIHLLLGLTYQDMKQPAEAKSFLTQALQYDANSTEARQALGLLLVQQNQLAEAVEVMHPLIEANVHNPTIWQAMAAAMKGLGDQESALTVLLKAHKHWPDDATIKNQLGHLLVESNRPDEAIPVLESAIAVRPTTGSLIDLATAYVMQQQHESALHLLERAIQRTPNSSQAWRGIAYCQLHLDNLPGAEDAARKAVAFDDQHFRSWHILADVLVAAGKINEALSTIETGLKLVRQAENGRLVQRDLIRLRAISLLQHEGAEPALMQIAQDLVSDPQNLALWQLRKDIELAIGQYEQALASLQHLLDAGMPEARAASDFYHIYHALNEPEKAWLKVESFLTQPETATNMLESLERTGYRLYNADQYEAAIAVFTQLHHCKPERLDWANNAGFIAAGLGKWEQATTLIRIAYDAGFEPCMALANLGYIYICQQRLRDAVETLQQVVNLAGDEEHILRVACWYKNDFSNALPERFPKQPLPIKLVAYLNLATAYCLMGEMDQALVAAQAGIAVGPELAIGYRVRGAVELAAEKVENARYSWEHGLTTQADAWEQQLLKDWLNDLE